MVLRFLAWVIDVLLILLPSYMLLVVLDIEGLAAVVLPQLLFAVYNCVATVSFNGKTIGKFFASLSVHVEDKGAIHYGMREVAKLLYFLPKIGILFILLNGACIFIFKNTIQDWLGKSQVLLDHEKKQLERGDDYERQFIR